MDEVEKLIRELAPARADGVAVPWRAPDGYVHLSVAMAKMWNALYRDAFDDWQDCYLPIAEGCTAAAKGEALAGPTDNGEGDHLVRFLTDIFKSEVVLTGHRQIGGGGGVEKMPGDWWDVEDLDLRFKSWSIDPADRVSQRVDLPHWIWVDTESFRAALAKVARARSAEPPTKLYFEDHWPAFTDAVATLSLAQPTISLPDKLLLMLCQSGAVQSQAGIMERVFRGKTVLRESLWSIPDTVWQRVGADPKNSPLTGKFYSCDGDTTLVLHDVMIEAASLADYLVRNGYSFPPQQEDAPEAGAPPIVQSAVNRGPDPYKEYPMLKGLFQAYDDKLSNMRSDRARHNYLKSIWLKVAGKMGRDTCPGYDVVRRCWTKFKA